MTTAWIVVLVAVLMAATVARGDLEPTDCTGSDKTCTTPEACTFPGPDGTSFPGCGCTCPGCPSCVQSKNPIFDKGCAANVVLVLDESASIQAENARDQVVSGVRSFAQVFSKVNDIGGTANLAIVEFSDLAQIILNQPPRMYRLTPDYLNTINSYLDAPCCTDKNSAFNYDPQYGCTNWEAALSLVKNTNWCAESADQQSCVRANPDVVVWFTDGAPTVHFGFEACDLNCNAQRVRQSPKADGTSAGLVGNGFGGDVGGACFFADQLKQQGTKLFLIGVGQVAQYEPNVQLVTGYNVWDPNKPDSFKGADYVLNLDFSQLESFFLEIAKGLCGCLQDQVPCRDAPAAIALPCVNATQFDTRVRIHTVAKSHQWPANALIYGWLYYQFDNKPARYAFQVQSPSSNFSSPGSTIVRTDMYQPCQVIRSITCDIGCFSVTDKSFIPRFFLSAGDVAASPTSGLTSTCGTSYRKALREQPESVEYLWVNAQKIVCAARAVDGTLYEFFQNNAGTVPGVNYRTPLAIASNTPTAPFNFEQYSNCPSKPCNAAVEVIYVVDNQFATTPRDDYLLVVQYVQSLLASYDDSNPRVKAGVVLNNGVRLPTLLKLTDDLAGLSRELGATAQQTGPFDFYNTTTDAINYFWPTEFRTGVDAPRYMLTIVGGPDAHGAWSVDEVARFKALKRTRGVESWATGVARGAINIKLLQDIGDSVPYTHFDALGSATLLANNQRDQSTLMCPTSDLCGDNCLGLCVCGECLCPNCVGEDLNNKCDNTCCDVETRLCSVFPKVNQIAPFGCLPVGPIDPGTKYTCEPTTGTCGVDNTCTGKSGCAGVKPCEFNVVDTRNCAAACAPRPRQCNCNDLCGSQCSDASQSCAGAITCNDTNSCTRDQCVVKNVNGVPTPTCEFVSISSQVCPTGSSSACMQVFCLDDLRLANSSASLPSFANVTDQCVFVPQPQLLDLCGVCLGPNVGANVTCFFAAPSTANVGAIIGGVIGGVAAAAVAALLAAWARSRANAGVSPTNALTSAALQTNPTYATPGLAGDMPAI